MSKDEWRTSAALSIGYKPPRAARARRKVQICVAQRIEVRIMLVYHNIGQSVVAIDVEAAFVIGYPNVVADWARYCVACFI